MFVLRKLMQPRILRRVMLERLTEPLVLNIAAAFVAAFGSWRSKVDFDLIVRPQHAYGLLTAAEIARAFGVSRITALEFGVANGAGLLNMCAIAEQVTRTTGVGFDLVGFDTGTGMPPPLDHRDHPNLYNLGDFPMTQRDALLKALPANCTIEFGPIAETVTRWRGSGHAPIGFVSIDVDYYSSTLQAFELFQGAAADFLPRVTMYFDDIQDLEHNPFCGELLAIEEFNARHPLRKIAKINLLRQRRMFQRARWIDHMYFAHIFDHAAQSANLRHRGRQLIDNPYLAQG